MIDQMTREQLLEIVKQLPLTKDQVPVTPQTELWDWNSLRKKPYRVEINPGMFNGDISITFRRYYSSESACRAAQTAN